MSCGLLTSKPCVVLKVLAESRRKAAIRVMSIRIRRYEGEDEKAMRGQLCMRPMCTLRALDVFSLRGTRRRNSSTRENMCHYFGFALSAQAS